MKLKKITLFIVYAMMCINTTFAHARSVKTPDEISDTLNFIFATSSEAAYMLGSNDNYMNRLSKFDIEARMQKQNADKESFRKEVISNIREWNDYEKKRILKLMYEFNDTIRKHKYVIKFPKEIILIKSTMADEGNACGYTRNRWIVLNETNVNMKYTTFLKYLLLHETFHVLTRTFPDFRKKMYSTIDFTVAKKEFKIPKDLRDLKISNPDVDRFDSYVTLNINGKEEKCAMFLKAKSPYNGGKLFDYMEVLFVALDNKLKPKIKDGKTVTYPIESASDFYEKIGNNTKYTINPEEILADNFVMAFQNYKTKSQNLTDSIRDILKGKR